MAVRAMWKAEVCVADERVPVKLYAAVQDRGVHFRLLHDEDGAPVEQRMVDPVDQEPVEREQVQRAVPVDRGVYVVLTEEERSALTPRPSRSIRVEQVLERGALELRWFDRPYYLGPDGDEDGYFALSQALAESDGVAIARWVMRNKRYQGALYSREGHLVLETLRHANELVQLEPLSLEPGQEPAPRERKLAEQLIEALEEHFDPAALENTHRQRVLQWVEDKARGREVTKPEPSRRERRDVSLEQALQASLARGKEKKRGTG